MSLHLTEEELYEVTGFRHREKVASVLGSLGVVFKQRPSDGVILVLREHYTAVMSAPGAAPVRGRREPNWARGS